MPDLSFLVTGVEPITFAASPMLGFKLLVRQTRVAAPIHAVLLRCQIRIDPGKRRYLPDEQKRLYDLFDRPERWGQTVRSMLWTHANVMLPPFTDEVAVELPVPCTFDLNVAAAKFFHALEGGEVPLTLLFNGTIFHEAEGERLQVAQIPWEKETTFRLPVAIWESMMEHYYPGIAWLCLRRDTVAQLDAFRRKLGLATHDDALERLLAAASVAEPAELS